MKTRAPASSANLGPGFDTLAVALGKYVEVELEPASSLSVEAEGEGSDLPHDDTHLAVSVAREVLGHDRVSLRIRSDIPLGRGLGSSAALSVAVAAAAGADDPLAIAVRFEGHCDNAAAAMLGGLVTGSMVDGVPVACRLPLDPDLRFVAVIPDKELRTAESRSVLPSDVPLVHASFNLGRMGLLLAGLADHRQLVSAATEDRLHQFARAPLFSASRPLMEALLDAGALASCWSGAGPTLLGIAVASDAENVANLASKAMGELQISGVAEVLAPDMQGLLIER